MRHIGWSLLTIALGLLMAGCQSDTPTVSVTITPTAASLVPGGTQTFTASVTGAADGAVVWSTTGGTLAGSGGTVVFTAPAQVGSFEVTVTSVADASKRATATVVVEAVEVVPDEEASSSIGTDGGTVALEESGALVVFGPGLLAADTEVRVATFAEPLVDYLPEVAPVAPGVRLEISAPLSALGGVGTLAADGPLTDAIVMLVPAHPGAQDSGHAVIEVSVHLRDDVPFVFLAPYGVTDSRRQSVSVPLELLREIHAATPLAMPIVIDAQPVDVSRHWLNAPESGELGLADDASDLPVVRGLYRVTADFVPTDLGPACADPFRERTPDSVELVTYPLWSANDLEGKTPVVLVHGWQVLARIGKFDSCGGAGMILRRCSELGPEVHAPQVCEWQEFLTDFHDDAELRASYALFTYGYHSDLSVARNASQFAEYLDLAFADTEVVVVAHSMGGLVADGALARAPKTVPIKHLITLGTPFRGSVALVCVEAGEAGCAQARVNDTLFTSQASRDLASLLSFHLGHAGTRDLAYEFGSRFTFTEFWESEQTGKYTYEAVAVAGIDNPFLRAANAMTRYRGNITAFVGEIVSDDSRASGYTKAVATRADRINYVTDGIVSIDSARLGLLRMTTGPDLDALIQHNVVRPGFDHGLIKTDNFDGIRSVLMALLSRGVSVSVDPVAVTLAPEQLQTFFATVEGASDATVWWDSDCGSFVDDANPVTYRAPAQAGVTCHVMAISAADPSVTATATVQVVAAGSKRHVLASTADGTGQMGADDDMDVLLNGTYLFQDPSPYAGPAFGPLEFEAVAGDVIRVVVRNNFQSTCSWSDVFLITPGGQVHTVLEGLPYSNTCPIGAVADVSVVVP